MALSPTRIAKLLVGHVTKTLIGEGLTEELASSGNGAFGKVDEDAANS